MITAQQFKQRWESVRGDRLVVFPPESLSDVQAPADAKRFLIEAGLPEAAAPELNFASPEHGALKRVSNAWQQPPTFNRYRIIGSNGEGDPLCIDEHANGKVVYLKHDNRFERALLASSVFTLAECLVEYRDAIFDVGGDADAVPPKRLKELLERFYAIDPAVCGEGSFWSEAFGGILPAGDKKWWQFWK